MYAHTFSFSYCGHFELTRHERFRGATEMMRDADRKGLWPILEQDLEYISLHHTTSRNPC